MNIFKKCFWTGHKMSEWDESIHSVRCYCCGTDNNKEPLGVKIINALTPIEFLLLVVLILVTVFFIIFLMDYPFSYVSCKQFAEQNALPFVYKFWYGCMVKYNGHWISPENLIQLLK